MGRTDTTMSSPALERYYAKLNADAANRASSSPFLPMRTPELGDQASSPRVGERFRLPSHGGEPDERIEWDPMGYNRYRIVSCEHSDLGDEAWTPRLVNNNNNGGGGGGGGGGGQQRRQSTRGPDAVLRLPGNASRGGGKGGGSGGGGGAVGSRPCTSGGVGGSDDGSGEFGKSMQFGRDCKSLTPSRAVAGRKSRQNWEPFTRFHVEREQHISTSVVGVGGGGRPGTSSSSLSLHSVSRSTRREEQRRRPNTMQSRSRGGNLTGGGLSSSGGGGGGGGSWGRPPRLSDTPSSSRGMETGTGRFSTADRPRPATSAGTIAHGGGGRGRGVGVGENARAAAAAAAAAGNYEAPHATRVMGTEATGGVYTSEAGASAFLPHSAAAAADAEVAYEFFQPAGTEASAVSSSSAYAQDHYRGVYASGGDFGYGAVSTSGPNTMRGMAAGRGRRSSGGGGGGGGGGSGDGGGMMDGLEAAAAAGDGYAAKRLESRRNNERHRQVKAMLVPTRGDGTKSLFPAAASAVALRADCAALNSRTDLLAAAFAKRVGAARRRRAALDAESDSHLGTGARIEWSIKELNRLELESLKLRVEDLVRGGYDREDARMHAGSYRTLAEQREEGLKALKRTVGSVGGMVGQPPSWRSAGAAGQAGVGIGAAIPSKARSLNSLAKKKAAEELKPRLTAGGNLKLEKNLNKLRSKVNEMTGGALSRLKLKREMEAAAAPDGEVADQKMVRFDVKKMVTAAAAARSAEEAAWEAAGGDGMVVELRAQCAALLAGESPADVAGALRSRALDRLHVGQRRDAASLRGLQRHAVTSSQSQRADPVTGQTEQPAASLIVSLLEERMAAAQRAWWFSERWERTWKEEKGVLEASEARTLAAKHLARELDALEAEIVSLRKENYQLRTAAGEQVVRVVADADADPHSSSSPSPSSTRGGGRGGYDDHHDAALDDHQSTSSSIVPSRSASCASVSVLVDGAETAAAVAAAAAPQTFIGAIQRISVGGDRIIGNAIKSSGFIDEDSDDEDARSRNNNKGQPRPPPPTASQRKTKRVMKLAEAWFQSGAVDAATEILPYELITAGESLSLLPAAFISQLFVRMPPAAAAAVFGILMPLSLRGEVLSELDDNVRREIVTRCGGAGLGGVAPKVVAAMLDSLDSASIAEALGDMGANDAAEVLVGLLQGPDGSGGRECAARAAATITAMDLNAAASVVACMPATAAAAAFDAATPAAAAAVASKVQAVNAVGQLATHMDVDRAGRMMDLMDHKRIARVLRAMTSNAAGSVAGAMTVRMAAAAMNAMHPRDAAFVVAAMVPAAAGAVLGGMAEPTAASSILENLEAPTVAKVLTSMPANAAGVLMGALASAGGGGGGGGKDGDSTSSATTATTTTAAIATDDSATAVRAAAVLQSMDADSSALALASVAEADPAAAAAALSRLPAADAALRVTRLAANAPTAVGSVLTALGSDFAGNFLTHLSPEEAAGVLHVMSAEHAGMVISGVMVASARALAAERRAAAAATATAASSRRSSFSRGAPVKGVTFEDGEVGKAVKAARDDVDKDKGHGVEEEEEEVPDFTGYPAAESVASIMASLEGSVASAGLLAMPPPAAAAVIFAAVTCDLFSTAPTVPAAYAPAAPSPDPADPPPAFTSMFTDSTEASAALVGLAHPNHAAAAAIINELPVGLAVTIFGRLSTSSSSSQQLTMMSMSSSLPSSTRGGGGGGGRAIFAREIMPHLAPHVRSHLSRAEELRKTRATITSLRGMKAKNEHGDWEYSVDRSVKQRELQRTMESLMHEMNHALGEIKDFSGTPDRPLVGLVAGLCVVTYGDFAARELLPPDPPTPAPATPAAAAEEGWDTTITVSTPRAQKVKVPTTFDLPREPAALAALWTKLASLITVEKSSAPSPRVSGNMSGGGGGNASSPEGGGGKEENGVPGASSPRSSSGAPPKSPRFRSKTMTGMCWNLHERFVDGDGGGPGAGGDKFFPWVDTLVNHELTLDGINRSNGPAAPVRTLSLWMSGLLAMRAQRVDKEEVLREKAAEAAREGRGGRAGAGAGGAGGAGGAAVEVEIPEGGVEEGDEDATGAEDATNDEDADAEEQHTAGDEEKEEEVDPSVLEARAKENLEKASTEEGAAARSED